MQLYQKYRPKRPAELVGHAEAKKRLAALIGRDGFDRGAFLISGPSGTGKTTLAYILANGICKAETWNIQELDGPKCTVRAVEDVERDFAYGAMGASPWKAVIVNECHAMTAKAVQSWLTLLEKIPGQRLVFFTTTQDIQSGLFGEFSSPFASRCYCLALHKDKAFAEALAVRAREIAQAEHLDGAPIEAYRALIAKHDCNFRHALNEIEQGVMRP